MLQGHAAPLDSPLQWPLVKHQAGGARRDCKQLYGLPAARLRRTEAAEDAAALSKPADRVSSEHG